MSRAKEGPCQAGRATDAGTSMRMMEQQSLEGRGRHHDDVVATLRPGPLDMAILEYLPLDNRGDIRLLRVHPGAGADPLLLDIYHSNLEQAPTPQFDALSYVWGPQSGPVEAEVRLQLPGNEEAAGESLPGVHFSIGQSLATSLKHLRFPDRPRTVWADAICINQWDYEERAQQVLMMGSIYRLARSVVAFLGPASGSSGVGMRLIERLGGAADVDFSTGLVRTSKGVSAEECREWADDWVDMDAPLALDGEQMRGVADVVQREWFERLWVRQEVGLGGSNSYLQCGDVLVTWHDFCSAIYVIQRKSLPPAPPAGGLSSDDNVVDTRSFKERVTLADIVALYSKRSFRFMNLRRQVGVSKCSDPRDRIYAVLGQLRESDRRVGIVPDYTKSVIEVYTDATRKHIQHVGTLAILSQCDKTRGGASGWELPSWVPDWSQPLHSLAIHEVGPELFGLVPAFESIGDTVLRAHGVRAARIVRVVELGLSSHDGDDDVDVRQTARELQYCLRTALSHDLSGLLDAYGDYEGILEVCCRALWLNNFSDRWYPAVPHEPLYGTCLEVVRAMLEPDEEASSSALERLLASKNVAHYIGKCRNACLGRSLFLNDDSRLGIGPDAMDEGDEVCCLFGHWKPLILRQCDTPLASAESASQQQQQQQQHRIVGECFIKGQMHGESVLGQLPTGLVSLLDPDGLKVLQCAGFIDTNTNRISREDPRLRPFLARLTAQGYLTEPTLAELERRGALDVLIRAGVPIEVFELV